MNMMLNILRDGRLALLPRHFPVAARGHCKIISQAESTQSVRLPEVVHKYILPY